MGRVVLLKNRYIRIIIATTGTARMIFSMGEKSENKRFEICVNIPNINPKNAPDKKPIKILKRVRVVAFIKGAVNAISLHFLNTVNGLGKISNKSSLLRLTIREAASQKSIQKVATLITLIMFFIMCVLVCFVVEIINW